MTYNFSDCKSVLKFDAKPWTSMTNFPSFLIVDNNKVFSHISDNPDDRQVVLVLNHELFQKFFGNLITQQNILYDNIRFTNEIKQITIQQNVKKFINDFHSIQSIGKGGFGRVYSAVHKMDLQAYAIKRVIIDCGKLKEDTFKEALKEFRILAKLDHGNIVRYQTAWFEIVENDRETASEQSNDSRYTRSVDSDLISSDNSRLTSSGMVYQVRSSDSSDNQSGSSLSRPSYSHQDEDIALEFSSNTSGYSRTSFSISSNSRSSENEGNGILEIRKSTIDTKPKLRFALYIQMELCQLNLKDWLDTRNNQPGHLQKIDLKNSRSLARQLLKGIEYLHVKNIIHRDMKPANIFLSYSRNCRNESELKLKIGDFGLAKSFEYEYDENGSCDNDKMTANVGTAFYTAPEVSHVRRRRINYNHKCDLYSVGIILLELMVKFQTISEFSRVIIKLSQGIMFNDLLETWPIEAPHVMNLISSSPQDRPEANFILSQTFCFKEIVAECGIYDQIKKLMLENFNLKKENESYKKSGNPSFL